MPARLRLIVPCYNEVRRLRAEPFLAVVTAERDIAILFVDDGSTDGTAEKLEEIAATDSSHISVLRLPENRGKANAVYQGVRLALEDETSYVGYWDADLSTPFSELPGMLTVLDTTPTVDIVMGSRVRMLGRRIDRRAARHYAGRLFATAASTVLRLPVYDTQCGAKIFRVNTHVREAFRDPFESRWIMDVEILARYLRSSGRSDADSRIYEVPLTSWTDTPGSKLRLTHVPGALWDLLRVWRS